MEFCFSLGSSVDQILPHLHSKTYFSLRNPSFKPLAVPSLFPFYSSNRLSYLLSKLNTIIYTIKEICHGSSFCFTPLATFWTALPDYLVIHTLHFFEFFFSAIVNPKCCCELIESSTFFLRYFARFHIIAIHFQIFLFILCQFGL